MFNSVLAHKDSNIIGDSFFKVFSIISYILAGLTFIIIDQPELIFISFVFNIFFGYIYSQRVVRVIPGMILLVLTNFLYVQIPVVYMCYKGIENNFQAFVSLPNDNNYYFQFLFPGLLYFLFAYFFILSGMILGNSFKFRKDTEHKAFKKHTTIYLWVILGFITFYQIWLDNANIFSARAESTEKAESILALLFNDKTYQLIFPILFYLIPQKTVNQSILYFVLILSLFLLLNISGTSKAALLQVFTFFFLGPLAFFYKSGQSILWPQKKLFVIGLILAIPLFLYSMFSRTIMGLGISLNLENILDLLVNSGDFDLKIIFDLIFERLSALVNNFILIYSTFSTNYSLDYSLHFSNYALSSLLNLVLPGTPFPESYVLTSQLFPKVIEQQVLESGLDRVTLLQQSNTQPYSLFGVLVIVFSPIPALIICFIFGFLLSAFFNLFRGQSIKVIIMYSFTAFFSSYGIEAVIQFFVITFITALILVSSLKIFDRIKI
jgi:hypothetical protein